MNRGALTRRKAWQGLVAHHAKIGATHLRDLFGAHPARGERLVLEAAELKGDSEPQLAHDSSTNALIRRYRRAKAAANESGSH